MEYVCATPFISADGELRLWDLAAGVSTRRFVGRKTFSPWNSQLITVRSCLLLVTVRSSCGTRLESVSTRSPTKVRDIRIGCCVRFSPNKLVPTIVSASWDQTVKVWNLENCKIRNTLAGHSGYLNTMSLSPDGSMCACGGKDGAVLLWDMAEGKTLCSLEAGSIIHSL
ncbi:hypothetical protein Bca4012_092129 [Brassica carinata]